MKIIYLRSFVKTFQSYSKAEQSTIYKTIEDILKYIETGQASYGLRIKKLHKRIYEARINISLRLAYFKAENTIKFFCLGNHDDIKYCLEKLRQIL